MPRGTHPNSLKALEENRHKGQFRGENTVEMKQKEIATKARKRTFREEFELELAAVLTDKNGNQTTVKNAITKTATQKALKGDLRAIEFIRDTIGEKPAENIILFEADPDIIAQVEMMVYDS